MVVYDDVDVDDNDDPSQYYVRYIRLFVLSSYNDVRVHHPNRFSIERDLFVICIFAYVCLKYD